MNNTSTFADQPDEIDGFPLQIVRKHIRHIYFRVYPKDQKILVSVPLEVSRTGLQKIIHQKKAWLEKQVKKAGLTASVQDTPSFLTCDNLWFKGMVYPLKYVTGAGVRKSVCFQNDCIEIRSHTCFDLNRRHKMINAWLRTQLKNQIGHLVKEWEPVIGATVREHRIRRMKTRWGSCNIRASRIWLNAALIHLTPALLEYVVVHEMVHLLERYHNRRFKNYMDRFIPQWRRLKMQLNRIYLE